jgi:hypothetical protein
MAAQLLPQHTPPTVELVLRQEPKLARMSGAYAWEVALCMH